MAHLEQKNLSWSPKSQYDLHTGFLERSPWGEKKKTQQQTHK